MSRLWYQLYSICKRYNSNKHLTDCSAQKPQQVNKRKLTLTGVTSIHKRYKHAYQ